MLVIKSQQIQHMAASGLERFKNRLLPHLAEHFPLRLELGGEAGLKSLIEDGVERARRYGLTSEAAMESFVDQMAAAGCRFDEDPIFASICDPLSDPAMGSDVRRMDAVYDDLWEFLDKAYGEDAENLLQAVSRLQTWLKASGCIAGWSEQDMLKHLEQIFPEKFEASEEAAVTAFYRQCVKRAGSHGFRQPTSVWIYTTGAFLTGIGFYGDPVFAASAARQLAALETATDPHERAGLLRQAVCTYAGRFLAAGTADMAVAA